MLNCFCVAVTSCKYHIAVKLQGFQFSKIQGFLLNLKILSSNFSQKSRIDIASYFAITIQQLRSFSMSIYTHTRLPVMSVCTASS